MTWRDIKGEDVDWLRMIRGYCRTTIWRRFQPPGDLPTQSETEGSWHGLTLGEICDMGVSRWGRYPGWGKTSTVRFKEALREIARDPVAGMKSSKAPDAFDPERD
jgi:hypothetical protein